MVGCQKKDSADDGRNGTVSTVDIETGSADPVENLKQPSARDRADHAE